ncbi:hypothetical protein niasHT_038474 [Heterodera trifolii]|uniref:mRNA cap guanine-N(7) methyltransferase n=1 Tax=Heterodera trifolii TaxID=157864 RepID=A0ABD2IS84_9BILA
MIATATTTAASTSSTTPTTSTPTTAVAPGDGHADASSSVPSSSSSVVASHYNALPEMGIQLRNDSRILHLRNFNNWMKSMLIAEFLERLGTEELCDGGATVLDLCCGKGGDLRKWRVGAIREIVMTDIAEVSLNDARERFHRMRDRRTGRPPFRAHFVPADLCEVSLYDHLSSDGPIAFDVCSCQFSLHYAFRSERCARQMLRNATDRLKPGGYFIGTVPDASAIMHYLRRSAGRFANEVCTVSIDGDANGQPPLFGAKIQFRLEGVVDCPEYLCYFPLLQQMLDEMGLELVYSKSFPDAIDHFMAQRGREARQLMESMNALETVVDARRLETEKGGAEAAQREYGAALARLRKSSGTTTTDGEGVSANDKDGSGRNEGPTGWGRRQHHQQQRQWHQRQQRPVETTVGTLSKSEWQVLTMYRVFAFRRRPRQCQTDADKEDDTRDGNDETEEGQNGANDDEVPKTVTEAAAAEHYVNEEKKEEEE